MKIKNVLFVVGPMLCMLSPLVALKFLSSGPFVLVIALSMALLSTIAYIVSYDSLKKNHSGDKINTQILLGSIGFMTTVFILVLTSADINPFGVPGTIITIVITFAAAVLMLDGIRGKHGSLRNGFSKKTAYMSASKILRYEFLVFLFCQIYLFYMSWFIFIPLITGFIVFATIYIDDKRLKQKEGIKTKKIWELSKITLLLFLIGISSLIWQYGYGKAVLLLIGGILVSISLVFTIVFITARWYPDIVLDKVVSFLFRGLDAPWPNDERD